MSRRCKHRCGCKYKYKYKYECACPMCTREYCDHSKDVADDPPPFRRRGFRRFPEFRESPRFRVFRESPVFPFFEESPAFPFFEESPFFGRRFR